MEIAFNLPHVFGADSNSRDDAYALRTLLDCLVEINLAYLRHYPVPSLYRSGVVYGRTVLWEPIPALYHRKYGDCKSLSAALVAQYLMAGVNCRPVFRWAQRNDGGKDFHILVQVGNTFEDPSRKLGMGSDEVRKFNL